MSVYACDIHGSRIRGSLESLRVTVMQADAVYSRRLRVCPTDLDELLRTHNDEWSLIPDEGLPPNNYLQPTCGHEVSQGARLVPAFVYVWRRNQPQAEYFADYCQQCGQDVVNAFGLQKDRSRDPL